MKRIRTQRESDSSDMEVPEEGDDSIIWCTEDGENDCSSGAEDGVDCGAPAELDPREDDYHGEDDYHAEGDRVGWRAPAGRNAEEDEGNLQHPPPSTDQMRVVVPGMKKCSFDSWAEFFAHLHEHESTTFQALMIRTSTSVKSRNDRIRANNGDETLILPLHYQKYSVSVYCTHHGEHQSRCTGARPRQEVRAMNCPFKMSATVQKNSDMGEGCTGPTHKINVTEKKLVHNHPVNEVTFLRYAHKRFELDDATLAFVEILRRTGAKKTNILQYIRDNTSSDPTPRDLQNLLARLKAEAQGEGTVEQRIEQWVEDFSADGNIGRVFVSESNVATCITLQTQHMRQMFVSFPEVLLIDATHSTNSANYKLFSFMIHDVNGNGQHVHHALIENERCETLQTVIEQFKSSNHSWELVECIVIDKDFTEMSVLRVAFPSARILLCQFHVIKYLAEEIAKASYGFTSWEKGRVKGAVEKLVYASTQSAYEKAHKYLSLVVGAPTPQAETISVVAVCQCTDSFCSCTDRSFWAYFNKNWHACREMWSSYARQNVAHLGNNTNNRLESSWRRIKEVVNRYMDLDECIFGIIYYQSTRERAYLDRISRLGSVVVHGYDLEMTQLANMVSKHACSLVEEQYNFALQTSRYRFYSVQEGMIFICAHDGEFGVAQDEPGYEYAVDLNSWLCSCLFMATRRLPCRHVLFIRKARKAERRLETMIPFGTIHTRWVLSAQARQVAVEPSFDGPFRVLPVKKRTLATLLPNQKFRLAMDASHTIGQALSELGTTAQGDGPVCCAILCPAECMKCCTSNWLRDGADRKTGLRLKLPESCNFAPSPARTWSKVTPAPGQCTVRCPATVLSALQKLPTFSSCPEWEKPQLHLVLQDCTSDAFPVFSSFR